MEVQEIEETNINIGIDKKPTFIIEPLILDRSKIIMKELMQSLKLLIQICGDRLRI